MVLLCVFVLAQLISLTVYTSDKQPLSVSKAQESVRVARIAVYRNDLFDVANQDANHVDRPTLHEECIAVSDHETEEIAVQRTLVR